MYNVDGIPYKFHGVHLSYKRKKLRLFYTGATTGTGTSFHSGEHDFTPDV